MNDAKHWFENMKNTPSFVGAEGLQPLWDKALSYGNKMEIPILFEGMSLRMSLIKSDTNHFSKSRLVLYKRGKNQYDAYILNFVPSNSFNKDINSINVSNYKEKKFDGKVFISGLDNQIMGVYNIVNGIKSNFSKIKIQRKSEIQLRDVICIDVCWRECGYHYESTNGVFTLVYGCRDVCDYNICIDDGNCSECEDPCLGPFATRPSWCGGDPCNEPLPPPQCDNGDEDEDENGDGSSNVDLIDQIVDNLTDPCFKAVNNFLLNGGLESDVNTFLAPFTTDKFLLSFNDNQVNSTSTDGWTDRPNSYLVDIYLNPAALGDASSEYVAATLIHEILHAYLGAELQINTGGQIQHNEMAGKYIDCMVNILRRFYPNLSSQDAIALSWGGLYQTAAWSSNLLSQSQKDNILLINKQHKNLNNECGPHGTPCP